MLQATDDPCTRICSDSHAIEIQEVEKFWPKLWFSRDNYKIIPPFQMLSRKSSFTEILLRDVSYRSSAASAGPWLALVVGDCRRDGVARTVDGFGDALQ